MIQEMRQFRLFALRCVCPYNNRPDLDSVEWSVQNAQAPVRTMTRDRRDEIIFEAPDSDMAWWICGMFPPLVQVMAMHALNGCSFELQEKTGPGTWTTTHEP